jgi:hypothetical protein
MLFPTGGNEQGGVDAPAPPFFFAIHAAALNEFSSNPSAISCSSQAVLEDFCEKTFTHWPANRDRSFSRSVDDAFRQYHFSHSAARGLLLTQGQEQK